MKNKLKGITLMETVLYIGLFSIVLFLILSFMLSTQEGNLRTQRRSTVHTSAQFLKQHFDYSFTKVIGINVATSVFNTDNSVLDLTFSSGTRKYSLSNTRILFNEVPITPSSVVVLKFFAEPIYNKKGAIVAVKVSTDILSAADSKVKETLNFLLVVR